MSISSISSISASIPVKAPTAVTTQPSNPPSDTTQNDTDDAGAAQPTVQAPLPPGQGTRIDQLV